GGGGGAGGEDGAGTLAESGAAEGFAVSKEEAGFLDALTDGGMLNAVSEAVNLASGLGIGGDGLSAAGQVLSTLSGGGGAGGSPSLQQMANDTMKQDMGHGKI
ncbi:MAG: hypothetical protein MI754_12635, partial [Chromatiales bacterium]|nr:hypothetical protein [Chromatiales bacterium]